MIKGINESKTLAKHISRECKCKFDGKNVSHINSGITIVLDVSVKKFMYVKRVMFRILLNVIVKMGNI